MELIYLIANLLENHLLEYPLVAGVSAKRQLLRSIHLSRYCTAIESYTFPQIECNKIFYLRGLLLSIKTLSSNSTLLSRLKEVRTFFFRTFLFLSTLAKHRNKYWILFCETQELKLYFFSSANSLSKESMKYPSGSVFSAEVSESSIFLFFFRPFL